MATAEHEAPAVDFDRLESSLRASIADLNDRRAGLALDAWSDPRAKTELERVESELADAEGNLRRLDLARDEAERREESARAEAAAELKQAALAAARDLQPRREKAAKAFDAAAAKFVAAMCEWVDVTVEQQRQLREAGEPRAAEIAEAMPYLVEGAIGQAIHDAESAPHHRRVLERLPYVEGARRAALAATDINAIPHVVSP